MAIHHLPDELLMSYASGSLEPATEILVASHLVLCPSCRSTVDEMENLLATWMEPPEDPTTDETFGTEELDALFDRLPPQDQDEALREEALGSEDPPTSQPALLPDGHLLPGPIWQALEGVSLDWKRVIPGLVHQIELPFDLGGPPVRLLRVRGGFYVPNHSHRGMELNMVLCGGYHDKRVGFERGDVQVADDSVTHDLHIDPGEECVILSVKESKLVPVGVRATLTHWLIGGI